jgi:hypothetical protein
MPTKLPPPNWKHLIDGDDRLVLWSFVVAFVCICLAEMFAGR